MPKKKARRPRGAPSGAAAQQERPQLSPEQQLARLDFALRRELRRWLFWTGLTAALLVWVLVRDPAYAWLLAIVVPLSLFTLTVPLFFYRHAKQKMLARLKREAEEQAGPGDSR